MQEFKLTKFKLALFSIPVVFWLIFPMVVWPFATSVTMSPQSDGTFEFGIGIFFILSLLLIAGVFFISAVCLIFRPLRLIALISLMICLASGFSFIVGLFAGGSISKHIQMNALAQLAEHSKPLIAAIKNYDRKLGHPPNSLDELVPEFIPKVPTTGIGVSPNYEFESLTNSSTYGKNPWVLYINHPTGHLMSFDSFIYLPLQDYSVLSYGHVVWRIGDWAYWLQG